MGAVFRIFFGAKGANKWAVLAALSGSSLLEAVGIAAVLPLLSLIFQDGAMPQSQLAEIVTGGLARLGLEPTLETLSVVIIAGFLGKAAVIVLAMRYVGYAVAEVATELRVTLIDRLLRARWGYFTSQPVGRITNTVSLDATQAGQAYFQAARFFADMLRVPAYIALAVALSPLLATIALGVGVVIAVLLDIFVRVSRKAGRRQVTKTRELVTLLSDALISIKPLKAMARHNRFSDFFDQRIKSLRKALRRQAVSQEMLKNLSEPLLAIAIVVGLWFGLRVWGVPGETLLMMGFLLERVVSTINRAQKTLQKAAQFEAAYWSVQELIAEAEAEREPVSGDRVPTLERSCRFNDVSFAFGEKQVLDHVSLDIPANRVTVITGRSGAGKTTITDLLLGLYQPTGGHVEIDGVPLEEIDRREWRRLIGYVPQELTLFHDTIAANVTLGDETFTDADVREALAAAGALEFVDQLPEGIETHVGERGAQLSGGQRQRVAIARALVHQPRLLILDEVTSALEPKTEAEIVENIHGLAGKRTILAITHRPIWVDIADRVYHVQDGTVQEKSPVAA